MPRHAKPCPDEPGLAAVSRLALPCRVRLCRARALMPALCNLLERRYLEAAEHTALLRSPVAQTDLPPRDLKPFQQLLPVDQLTVHVDSDRAAPRRVESRPVRLTLLPLTTTGTVYWASLPISSSLTPYLSRSYSKTVSRTTNPPRTCGPCFLLLAPVSIAALTAVAGTAGAPPPSSQSERRHSS